MTTTAFTLGPTCKLGTMIVMTRSLLKASQGEAIFTMKLAEDASDNGFREDGCADR
jgi:hypothetical protein